MSNAPIREEHPDTTKLKGGALGVPSIVFFVVAAAAPLAASLGAGPVVFIFAGPGAPAMYLISAVVLLLFAVGFAAMSRYVTSAGGFVSFAARGLGRWGGYAAAGVAIVAYLGMLLGIFGQFSVFTAELFAALFGWEVPWQVVMIVGIVVIGVLGYLDINVSMVVVGVLIVLELAALLLFDFAVLFQGGADGVNLDAFAWDNVVTPGLGAGLLFAFTCYVGFEATVIYGEEARNPKRTVPRATYLAIILIGVVYTFTMWAAGLAHGTEQVQTAAIEHTTEFFFIPIDAFVGPWATPIVRVLTVTSLVAVLLAFHNTMGRYLFSLGRARFLWTRLGRTHPRFRSPAVASVSLSIVSLVVLGIFILAGADPMAVIFTWLVGVGGLGILVMQSAGAASVVAFFARNGGANLWVRLIAPGLGFLGLVAAIVLAVLNFDLVVNTPDGPALLLPWLLVVAAAAGLVIGAVRARSGTPPELETGFEEGTQLEADAQPVRAE